MIIRETDDEDLKTISAIHETAFGQPDEAGITADLLGDPSAAPRLSLIAIKDEKPVGHILFTNVILPGLGKEGTASILCPMAVLPDFQGQGIGGELIHRGLKLLADRGAELVFVLGYPDYYPRFGFHPAGAQNLQAPYPIPPENADAWMVQALKEGVLGKVQGQIKCADMLNKEEYWAE